MSKSLTVNYHNKPIYEILIEQNWDLLGKKLTELKLTGKKFCIVSDSNVAPLYLEELKQYLSKNANPTAICDFVFQAGEEYKTLDTVKELYKVLIEAHFERGDLLFALGGGVVGDLTGYTAATYLRGIAFIQLPTTLLAQVDSSIGGKTGVDFDSYKNMVGAFHMPRLVYMNVSTLNTLDQRIYLSGYGEIIKHALIKDADYLTLIEGYRDELMNRDLDILESVIYESCKIKGKVVNADPTEKGERMLLNFGHTLGHAIEKLCGFSLYHGECVILGMICALKISLDRGLIRSSTFDRVYDLIKCMGFTLNVSGINAEEVINVSRSDKKMKDGKIRFILVNRIGDAFVDYKVTDSEMLSSLCTVLKE